MPNKISIGLIALCTVIYFTSCDERVCEEDTDVYLNAGFYTMSSGFQRDSIVQDLTLYGAGRSDSLIYDQSTRQKIYLPLSKHSDTSRFILQIAGIQDELTLISTRKLKLISHECGFITEYDIQEIQSTTINIDSAIVVQHIVTNFDEEHIKIFLQAATP